MARAARRDEHTDVVDAVCLGTDPRLIPQFSSLTPGSDPRSTCVILHRRDGATHIFFLDLATRLYMPQAGNTDTLVTTDSGGWAVRSRDGSVRQYNADGALIEDRDRFGNGFRIEYKRRRLCGRSTRSSATPRRSRHATKPNMHAAVPISRTWSATGRGCQRSRGGVFPSRTTPYHL